MHIFSLFPVSLLYKKRQLQNKNLKANNPKRLQISPSRICHCRKLWQYKHCCCPGGTFSNQGGQIMGERKSKIGDIFVRYPHCHYMFCRACVVIYILLSSDKEKLIKKLTNGLEIPHLWLLSPVYILEQLAPVFYFANLLQTS